MNLLCLTVKVFRNHLFYVTTVPVSIISNCSWPLCRTLYVERLPQLAGFHLVHSFLCFVFGDGLTLWSSLL